MWFVIWTDIGFGEEYIAKGETIEIAWANLNGICKPIAEDCCWYNGYPANVVAETKVTFSVK